MADAEAPFRKRDRLKAGVKARAKRYMTVPLAVRTADLPRRIASALIMLAVAGAALWMGGLTLTLFIALVATGCLVELILLVVRATPSIFYRLAAILAGASYIGLAAAYLATMPGFYVLLALGVVIFTDSCAYFAGRTIGGPKIAPAISPSKTWAGLLGGMTGAALFAFVYVSIVATWFADVTRLGIEGVPQAAGFAVFGALLAIAAQCGDFFESWLKRKAHKKDSSNLIPGHGGIFDRIDGLLPVAILVGLAAAASA